MKAFQNFCALFRPYIFCQKNVFQKYTNSYMLKTCVRFYAENGKESISCSAGRNIQPTIIPPEGLLDYITSHRCSLDELMNIDIRDFPVELRLSCLEAVIQTALLRKMPSLVSRRYPSLLSPFDRLTEAIAASLGIDPSSTATIAFLPPVSLFDQNADWLKDERFNLLTLSTVAGAKNLPRPRLLVLVACLRQIPVMVDSKAMASVLRLITHQINDCSTSELVYTAALLSGIQHKPQTPNLDDLAVLGIEADLLREALRHHVMSRLTELESLGLLTLLKLAYDIGPDLTIHKVDSLRFLSVIETVIATRLKEQNLFTLCLLFAAMQRMGTFRPGLIRRCLGQIRRKLHLTVSYPLTDQSAWLSGSVAALANLGVGNDCLHSNFSIGNYSTLAYESSLHKSSAACALPNGLSGLDIHPLLTSDWVRQLLFDVGDYVLDRSKSDSEVVVSATRTTLALIMLGVRHEGLLSRQKSEVKEYADLLITEPSELILPSEKSTFDTLNGPALSGSLRLVSRLPRIDWQLYYELKFTPTDNFPQTLTARQRDLFHTYVALKKTAVETFITQIQSRIGPEHLVEILPFHFIEVDSGRPLFADFVIRKKSSTDPSVSKCAVCFLIWKRDELVPQPFRSLMISYAQSSSIPVVPFVYCDWLSTSEANNRRDAFLKKVAITLTEFAGIASEQITTRPFHEVLHEDRFLP